MVFVLVLLSLLLVNPYKGYPQSINQVLDTIQAFYENTKNIRAEFEQETIHPNGQKEVRTGRVWIKKPGLFRWEYLTPEKFIVISDGTNLYVYYPEEKRVFVYPTGKAISSQLALGFMSGRGDIRKDLRIESYKSLSENLWELNFLPLSQENQVERLTLFVDLSTGEVKRFVVWHKTGEKVLVNFRKLEYNVNMPEKIFNFTPPKDAKIN